MGATNKRKQIIDEAMRNNPDIALTKEEREVMARYELDQDAKAFVVSPKFKAGAGCMEPPEKDMQIIRGITDKLNKILIVIKRHIIKDKTDEQA